MVTLPDGSDQSYIEISIIADNGVSLGNITVFLLKFVSLLLPRNNSRKFKSKEIAKSLSYIIRLEKLPMICRNTKVCLAGQAWSKRNLRT